MQDFYSVLYGILIADTYFATFTNSDDEVKIHKGDSSYDEDKYITIDVTSRKNNVGWNNHDVIFTIHSKEWQGVYDISDELERVINKCQLTRFGKMETVEGYNPVTESHTLSIGANFGSVI